MFIMEILDDANKQKEDLKVTHNFAPLPPGITTVNILMSVFLDYVQCMYMCM